MSVLIAAKLKNSVVLATDSRFWDLVTDRVEGDSAQKVFQLGPDAFFATAGFREMCDWQTAKVQELARRVGTSDIRILAQELDRASVPSLERLIQDLRMISETHESTRLAATGQEPFAGYALIGSSGGVAGYIAKEFVLQDGQVAYRSYEVFDLPEGQDWSLYLTRGPLVANLIGDPETWKRGLVPAVERLLTGLCQVHAHCGGAFQVARVDDRGGRWVHRPPVQKSPESPMRVLTVTATLGAGVVYVGTVNASQVNTGTLNAVNMSGGTLVLNQNGITTKLENQTVTGLAWGLTVQDNTDNHAVMVSPGSVRGTPDITGSAISWSINGGKSTDATLNLFSGATNTARVLATAGDSTSYLKVTSSSGSVEIDSNVFGNSISINGSQVLSTRVTSTPATLADVIAVLQHHGLSN